MSETGQLMLMSWAFGIMTGFIFGRYRRRVSREDGTR